MTARWIQAVTLTIAAACTPVDWYRMYCRPTFPYSKLELLLGCRSHRSNGLLASGHGSISYWLKDKISERSSRGKRRSDRLRPR